MFQRENTTLAIAIASFIALCSMFYRHLKTMFNHSY
nr:MAG TPA: hypothetical protein [Caudoviricetes sp.]